MKERSQPNIILLGDEDRASLSISKARSLYFAGHNGAYTEDDTVIQITGNVVTIETTHHAPMSIFSPLDNLNGVGYYLWLLGCSHRKDAMLTAAQYTIRPSNYEVDFPNDVGAELIYMTDGVAFCGHAAFSSTAAYIRTYVPLVGMFGFTTITEDNIKESTGGFVGVGRIEGALTEISCCAGEQQQGDNYYSVVPYGVDRTDPLAPKYRFTVGCLLNTGGQQSATFYRMKDVGGVPTVVTCTAHYHDASPILVYITGQRGQAPTAFYYDFGDEIIFDDIDYQYDSPDDGFKPYIMAHNAPFPVLIPLGDKRVFMVYRKKDGADSSLMFGYKFNIFGKVISGMTMTQTDANVDALKVEMSSLNAFPLGTVGTPGAGGGGPYTDLTTTIGNDINTQYWITETLAVGARSAIPVSQDETLVIAFEGQWEPWIPAGDENGTLRTVRQVCYSFTSTGVTKKGTLVEYYGHWPQRPAKDYFYEFHGACHGSGQNVYALFERYAWSGSVWNHQGVYLFSSSDNGTTWTGPTSVTLRNDDADQTVIPNSTADGANTVYFLSSQLVYIGRNAADTGDVLCIGMADFEIVTGARKLKNPKLLSSEDSGLNFQAYKSGGAGREYTWVNGSIVPHSSRGLCAVQLTGDAVDGFEPSPYRHLPTYYGTPTKVCRTFSEPGQ